MQLPRIIRHTGAKLGFIGAFFFINRTRIRFFLFEAVTVHAGAALMVQTRLITPRKTIFARNLELCVLLAIVDLEVFVLVETIYRITHNLIILAIDSSQSRRGRW